MICRNEILTRNEAEDGDDDVSSRDAEELVPRRSGGSVESDLLKDDVLVEVDAVEPVKSEQVSVSEHPLKRMKSTATHAISSRNQLALVANKSLAFSHLLKYLKNSMLSSVYTLPIHRTQRTHPSNEQASSQPPLAPDS